MTVEFLKPAEVEFREAIAFYNRQGEGLGFEFATEVKRTIARIVQFPEAWQGLAARTRRCRTNRFPYGVLYQLRGETILVIAVMHLRRRPDAWRSRVVSP